MLAIHSLPVRKVADEIKPVARRSTAPPAMGDPGRGGGHRAIGGTAHLIQRNDDAI